MWTIEKYADMYRDFPNGMYRTSLKTGEFLEANQGLADILGYETPEELKESITALDIYADPKDRDRLIDHLSNCDCKKSQCKPTRVKFIDRDGDFLWVMITGRVNEEEGYIEGAIIDIDESITDTLEELQIITEVAKRRAQEIDIHDNCEPKAHAG